MSSILVGSNRQTVCILYTLQCKSSWQTVCVHYTLQCKSSITCLISHAHEHAIASVHMKQMHPPFFSLPPSSAFKTTTAKNAYIYISTMSFQPSESKTLYSPLKNTYISYRPPHSKALNSPSQNPYRHFWTAKHCPLHSKALTEKHLFSRQQNTYCPLDSKTLTGLSRENTYRPLQRKHLQASPEKNTYRSLHNKQQYNCKLFREQGMYHIVHLTWASTERYITTCHVDGV